MFTTDKNYNVKMIPLLSEKGVFEINTLLYDNISRTIDLTLLDSLELKTKQGKIAKRISKLVWKNYAIKLSSKVISEIGNICQNNTISGDYNFTISADMDIFSTDNEIMVTNEGGSRSCFDEGGCYRDNYDSMDESDDFFAVRIFQDGEWIARSWLNVQDETLAVFNSYGLQLNKLSLIVANGLDLKTVQGNYHGSDIYINSNRINLIGENVRNQDNVTIDCENVRVRCYNCIDELDRDYQDNYTHEGEYYCESCYGELFSYCDTCGDVEPAEDGYHTDNGFHCEHCFNENFTSCNKCYDPTANDEITELNNNEYCQTCYDEIAITCEICEYVVKYDNTIIIDNKNICEDCKDEYCTNCNTCEELIINNECKNCQLELGI